MNFFIRPEILFLIPFFIGVLLLLHFHSRKKVRQRIRLLVADKLKNSLINKKKNEQFVLYSKSHLSKLRNNNFIENK